MSSFHEKIKEWWLTGGIARSVSAVSIGANPNAKVETTKTLNKLASYFHHRSSDAGWWPSHTQEMRAVKIALIHSELSEALEGIRKDTMDIHLPHRKSAEVEMADVLIRVLDLAGEMNLDLDGAIWEKDAYNAAREDHKLENRDGKNGKKF